MFGVLVCAWIAIIGLSFTWNWYQVGKSAIIFAAAEARASHEKDLVYRRWSAQHGGVYVSPTEATPPNPYLSHLPNRDLVTTDGKQLTLVNPAYMTRQVHALGKEQYGALGHITSLTPLNPNNAADSWEAEALRLFETGNKEVVSSENINGQLYLRLIRPLITEKSCLNCHASQGYKEGDIRGGISVSVPESPYSTATGQQRKQLLIVHLLIGIIGLLGLFKGNNLLRSAGTALVKSEERFRRVSSLISDVAYSCSHDAEGFYFIDWMTGAAEKICGYSIEEIKAKKCWRFLVVDEDLPVFDQNIINLTPGSQSSCHLRIRHQNGNIVWIASNAECVMEPGTHNRVHLYGSLIDITERKRSEENLHESREMLKAVLNAIPVRVFWKDKDLKYLGCNMAFAQDAGCKDPEDVIGKTDNDLAWQDQAEFYQADDRAVIESGESRLLFEESQPSSSGEDIHLLTSKVPLRDIEGEIVGVLGAYYDITQRKQAEGERDKLQSQMNQIKKMESIGRLAGGVAHDFNNMLGVILGYTQIALEETEPNSSLHQHLLRVLEAGQRSADITRQLLAFARKQQVAPKILNLNEIIEQGTLLLLRRLIGENIDLAWKPKAKLWAVKMDSSQIDQILINVCANARDAIKGTGIITIETDKVILDEVFCTNHPGATPGAYVLLKISDDGGGMDKEILDNIFEPFFTTKGIGQGTGLGLATVFGIVKQNNGFIDVASVHGEGTTFSIFLPRYEDQPVPARNDTDPLPIARLCNETILLVEDEPMILEMANIILQAQGYVVLSATTPNKAIELAEQHSGQIDLLITDVIMPEMNGRDLASRLRSRHQDFKLLFMSGYTADVIDHQGILDENCNFLQKPFSSKDFRAKIREILKQ